MAKGVRDLRETQIKFCATLPPGAGWDVAQVPAARIVGQCGMKKLVNRVLPTEATGLMSDHIIDRYYDPWIMAELPITPGDEGLTFNQFPWFLEMGAVGGITPVGVAPAAQVWTFIPVLTAADMPQVASIGYGDNAGSWISHCCFARNLVISGAFQGPWQIDADIVGRDMEVEGLIDLPYPTDAASFGPLQTILGQMTVLNTHPSCTFAAPTPVEGSLIDWRITIPGFHAKFFQDGALYYSIMGLASRHLTFEATVEWDSVFAAAEHAIWAASHMAATPSAPRYMQLVATGGLIPLVVPAASYQAQIDMVLMYESFETLDQRDGNDIVKFTARTAYDVGCAVAGVPEWQVVVTNGDAALP